jgi:hypothetical protein
MLAAYAIVVDEGRKLRVAADAPGTSSWHTGEEAERAAKEEALRRIASLEAALRGTQRS